MFHILQIILKGLRGNFELMFLSQLRGNAVGCLGIKIVWVLYKNYEKFSFVLN
jgi:hypothetical protein